MESEYPFYDGINGVTDLKKFVGRQKLLNLFEKITTFDGNTKKNNVLCIVGKSSFGKSSFKDRCLSFKNMSSDKNLNCYFSFLNKTLSKPEFYREIHFVFDNEFSKTLKGQRTLWRLATKPTVKYLKKLICLLPDRFLKWSNVNPYPNDLKELISFIYRRYSVSVKPLSFITFIFDDVSASTCSALLCNDIIMDLSAEFDKSLDLPSINIMILGLPGWKDVCQGHGLERRTTGTEIELKPLSITELKFYLDSICSGSMWEYDSQDFIDCLYAMSGGMPYLLNQIGIGACKACQNDVDKFKLKSKHVINAITTNNVDINEGINKAIDVVIKDVLIDNLNEISNDAERRTLGGFYKCCPIEQMTCNDKLNEISNGFTKDDWKNKILDLSCDHDDSLPAFETIWKRLYQSGYLVRKDDYPGQYSFCAEVIRYDLKRFN